MTDNRTYDRDADRQALLEATLSHAAFDGWSQKAFDLGAKDAGIPADRALNAFPGGLADRSRCSAASASVTPRRAGRVRKDSPPSPLPVHRRAA